jgi:hypothetical protein
VRSAAAAADPVDGGRRATAERVMALDDERVQRDDVPVPESLDELRAQVVPEPPPLPAPRKARLEPPGSFIRTRVSKKEKQAGKRQQFVDMLAAAAAARQPARAAAADATMAADADAAPAAAPTDSFVDDFLSAMADMKTASGSGSGGGVAVSASTRTIQQRARIERSEQKQFKAVLSHEAFKSDPLGALREHVANRLKLEAEQRARQAASLSALDAQERGASRRLQTAMEKNRGRPTPKKR